jgi:hypothetical protein
MAVHGSSKDLVDDGVDCRCRGTFHWYRHRRRGMGDQSGDRGVGFPGGVAARDTVHGIRLHDMDGDNYMYGTGCHAAVFTCLPNGNLDVR